MWLCAAAREAYTTNDACLNPSEPTPFTHWCVSIMQSLVA